MSANEYDGNCACRPGMHNAGCELCKYTASEITTHYKDHPPCVYHALQRVADTPTNYSILSSHITRSGLQKGL